MNSVLNLPAGLFEELLGHLLPAHSQREQAAFLFVSTSWLAERISFNVIEAAKLHACDFETQTTDYLELKDPKIREHIKKSHLEYLAGKSRPAEELLAELRPTERKPTKGTRRQRL